MRKLLAALIAVCFLTFFILENQPANMLDSYDKALIEYVMGNSIPNWHMVNEIRRGPALLPHPYLYPFSVDEMHENDVVYVNEYDYIEFDFCWPSQSYEEYAKEFYDRAADSEWPFEVHYEAHYFSFDRIYLDMTIKEISLFVSNWF